MPPHPEALDERPHLDRRRLPVALNHRVRAAAKRRKVSLNAFLIEALTQALGPLRVAQTKRA